MREQTTETDERRATVSAAREAVEDMKRGSFGGSGDIDYELLQSVRSQVAVNGRPYNVEDNERLNHDEEEEEPVNPFGDGLYVPTSEQ